MFGYKFLQLFLARMKNQRFCPYTSSHGSESPQAANKGSNMVQTGSFEVVAIWDGELFAHTCATLECAFMWAEAYTEQENCVVRIWKV